MTCETTLAPTRFKKPRPLLPMATASVEMPWSCNSRSLAVTTRNTLVFMPPHNPLSVVTTMTPTFCDAFTCMNGCTYSGLAWPRWAAMLRIFSL
ncbi:hypothetical protein D3C71_1815830 [compost metagenome]